MASPRRARRNAADLGRGVPRGAFRARRDAPPRRYALKKFAQAFEVVPRALAQTSGQDQTEVIAELRDAHAAGDAAAGVDLTPDGAEAKNAAVFDVLAVKESALRFAVDAAITVLRVDQIIMSKPAGGPKK